MPRGIYTRADRRPTWTHLTVEAMKSLDDFATLEQLMRLTGMSGNQARATVHHLKSRHVIDAMEADGRLWYYLTGEDDRAKTLEERVEEPKGNRTRRPYTRKKKEE